VRHLEGGDPKAERQRREATLSGTWKTDMSKWSHLYNDVQWRKLRARQLRDEPLCRMCKARGQITLATICDHIEPHKGDLVKFWSGPFMSLCAEHHSSDKQRIENGRKPKPYIGLDGFPIG